MEKIYTISEIGKLLGLSNDAVRFYRKERTGSSRYQSRKQISHVYDTNVIAFLYRIHAIFVFWIDIWIVFFS